MTRRSVAVVGLLLGSAFLGVVVGRAGRSDSRDPPPVVIGPRAVLLRTPDASSRVSVAFSPDGRTVAAGRTETSGAVASLCDVATRRERATIKMPSADSCAVAFSPDGRTLAVGSGRAIELFDPETARERAQWEVEGVADCVGLAFSADGRRLAAATEPGCVVVWDVGSGRRIASLRDRTPRLRGIAVSPDGEWLATAVDGPIVCHRMGWSFFGFGASGWACGPDGGYVRTFRVSTGQENSGVKLKWTAHSVSFSPDGKLLASGGGGTAMLRDIDTGKVRTLLAVESDRDVHCVAFSPDGLTLAIGVDSRGIDESEGEVKLWDLRLGRVRAVLRGEMGRVRSMAFAPDGRGLVTGSREDIVLWDLSPAASQSDRAATARHF